MRSAYAMLLPLRRPRFTLLFVLVGPLVGCIGTVDGGSPGASGSVIEIPDGASGSIIVRPQPRTMARLTASQYRHTIEDLFGPDVAPSVDRLPADLGGEDFRSIGANLVGTAGRGVELYGEAALGVAGEVWASRDDQPLLRGCSPTSADDPCITEAIRSVGRRLFRRPLSNEEANRYVAIVQGATAHPDAAVIGADEALDVGMRYALSGLLQSPHFLYVSYEGEVAGNALRYSSLDMASRIALVVLDSTPDEALLSAGEAGELEDPANVEAHIRRLLGTERGQELVTRFFVENWEMTELEGIQKDDELFPQWSTAVASAASEEFRLTLLDIATDENASILDVFAPRPTFINDALAPIYEVPNPGSDFVRVELNEERVGLLTSVAFLAANAKPNRTSPAERGLFLLWRGLCQSVPEPPPGTNTELPEDDPATEGLSLRERLALHRADPACAGCHEYFDGLGLALEGFDAIGMYRTVDNGVPVDPRGEFQDASFADQRDLAAFLRNSEDASVCLSSHFYRFATGHSDTGGEQALIESIAEGYPSAGPRFDDVVVGLMTSAGFRHYAEETEQ